MSFKPFKLAPFHGDLLTFRDHVDEHLLKLSKKGKPLALLYSGGIDSEILAMSMIDQGIEFKMFTGRNIWPLGVMNEYDLNMASRFSKKYGVQTEYMDFDFEKIFKSDEYLDIITKVGMPISLTAPMHLMIDRLSKRGFYPIKASGEPIIIKPGKTTVIVDDEVFRTEELLGLDCTISFFEDSAGIFLSWLDDPIIVEAVKNIDSSNMYLAKFELYHKHFPGLVKRRKQNGFNGYEQYISFKHLQVSRDFAHLITHTSKAQYVEYASFVKFLKGDSKHFLRSSIVDSPVEIYWDNDDASSINTNINKETHT